MAFTPLKFKFDKELLELLSAKLIGVDSNFDHVNFKKETQPILDPLELKDRVNTIADQLRKHVDGGYEGQIKTLISILGPENEGAYGTFNDYFWTWPIGAFIERHGMDHFDLSIDAINEVTRRGTGEFAIRPYLLADSAKVLDIMHGWSLDDNFHVRRLSSEGLRPNLPWASKIKIFNENPSPILKVIKNLKNDPIRYVQTSVANIINDLLKVNYDFGKSVIDDWSESPGEHTRWIVKHAIRNYRKKEVPWALALTNRMNNL